MNLLLKYYLLKLVKKRLHVNAKCRNCVKKFQKFQNTQIFNRYEESYLQRSVLQTIDEEIFDKSFKFQ